MYVYFVIYKLYTSNNYIDWHILCQPDTIAQLSKLPGDTDAEIALVNSVKQISPNVKDVSAVLYIINNIYLIVNSLTPGNARQSLLSQRWTRTKIQRLEKPGQLLRTGLQHREVFPMQVTRIRESL